MGIRAGANIVLNFWLIPRYNLVGAAIATLASETLVVALLYAAISRVLGPLPLFGIVVRPGVAAAAMGVFKTVMAGSFDG